MIDQRPLACGLSRLLGRSLSLLLIRLRGLCSFISLNLLGRSLSLLFVRLGCLCAIFRLLRRRLGLLLCGLSRLECRSHTLNETLETELLLDARNIDAVEVLGFFLALVFVYAVLIDLLIFFVLRDLRILLAMLFVLRVMIDQRPLACGLSRLLGPC